MEKIKKYLDNNDISRYIDYTNFKEISKDWTDATLDNIKNFIENKITDILIVDIQEDKLFLTEKELEKLPKAIKHYLKYSESGGMKLYVFNAKNWWFKMAVGLIWSTAGRVNKHYFNQIVNDEKYKNISSSVSIKLTELLG